MNEELQLKLKQKLEKEKELLEKELQGFAKKSETLKGDWKTRFPKFNGGKIEEEADEIEEYETLLPIEYNLELRLKDINSALNKIKKSGPACKYGICEKCGKSISKERLNACPEAKTCAKCK
ncbi:TraR/DksA C4-type zinc finger protein [Candidatus Parcubacteria bacterium]|nr:TraR/DksA C4-type zinc finger protein [Candidatus Parcubacteria bacterium]